MIGVIEISDDCELVQEGNKYIVKPKDKHKYPKSWEEFYRRYPKQNGNCFIDSTSEIATYNDGPHQRFIKSDKNVCYSEEEAEAFLALMQLRQLWRAWTLNEEFKGNSWSFYVKDGNIGVGNFGYNKTLPFPTLAMAEEFALCFKGLLVKASTLL